MRNILVAALFSLVTLGTVACGGTTNETTPATAEQKQGLNDIGDGCSSDSQCGTGLCWDTADSYPVYNPSWESGNVCTVECEPGTEGDAYCRELAAEYGAPRPQGARCLFARAVYDNGEDAPYYVCDLIAAGLGSYWSE